MKQYISTHIFNPRLFVEGLKRLKVFSFASAILSVTLSVLVPAIQWIGDRQNDAWYSYSFTLQRTPSQVDYPYLIIPIYLLVFIAPFMVLSLFSYLHKRKEADFFHAVPYTRTCVYVSFTLSALASVFAIMLLSAVAAGIVWTLNPYTYFLFADMAVQVLVCMLAAAFLCAIMAVCVMLTGTSGMSVCLFALSCVLWRYILYLFQESINYYVICKESMLYLNWDWFLPFRLFTGTFESYQTYGDRFPLSQILYTLVLTLALFVLAGFLYKKRKSEMAGNTAPNRTMQHIFRCLFTLPAAMLMPFFMIADDGSDFATIFIVVIASLLIYYLFELITTKSFKGFIKATPWLLGVVAAILLFCGAHGILKQVILYENIDADEIAWVKFDDCGDVLDKYQLFLLDESIQKPCDDETVIQTVADALHESQVATRTDNFSGYIILDNEVIRMMDDRIITTQIKLKNGRVITRNIMYHDDKLQKMLPTYADDIANTDITRIPEETYLDKAYIIKYTYQTDRKRFDLEKDDLNDLMKLFLQEYEALSREDRMLSRNPLYTNREFIVTMEQRVHSIELRLRLYEDDSGHTVTYSTEFFITQDLFPQTYDFITQYHEKDDNGEITEEEIEK